MGCDGGRVKTIWRRQAGDSGGPRPSSRASWKSFLNFAQSPKRVQKYQTTANADAMVSHPARLYKKPAVMGVTYIRRGCGRRVDGKRFRRPL